MNQGQIKKFLFFGAVSIGIIFFFLYSFLSLTVSSDFFNSPDEKANAFFSQILAIQGRLSSFEPLNFEFDNRLHPRSTKVVNGFLVPGGFLGLPVIFGEIARVVGTRAIPFLTPVFSLLAVLVWAAITGQLFSKKVGFLAGVFLLINPVWWYWSSRSLMPNILSLFLLLTAIYFLLLIAASSKQSPVQKRNLFDSVAAGFFFGLALAVRPDMIYWSVIIVVILILSFRKWLFCRSLIIAGVSVGVTLIPFALINHSLYGSFLLTGYGDVAATIQNNFQSSADRLLGSLRPLLFPLGLFPRTAWHNFINYGLRLFSWWWLLLIITIPFLVKNRRSIFDSVDSKRNIKLIIWIGSLISIWLILFYGSWKLQDNPDPRAITIGVSYTRYWLPIFVLSTLPLALVFSYFLRSGSLIKNTLVISAVFIIALCSGYQVFWARGEGLLTIRSSLKQNQRESMEVIGKTEAGAIIAVDRADKYLFPWRSVMNVSFSDENIYPILLRAVALRPTYYYGLTLPERDSDWLQKVKLQPLGLMIEPVISTGENSLYVFHQLKK